LFFILSLVNQTNTYYVKAEWLKKDHKNIILYHDFHAVSLTQYRPYHPGRIERERKLDQVHRPLHAKLTAKIAKHKKGIVFGEFPFMGLEDVFPDEIAALKKVETTLFKVPDECKEHRVSCFNIDPRLELFQHKKYKQKLREHPKLREQYLFVREDPIKFATEIQTVVLMLKKNFPVTKKGLTKKLNEDFPYTEMENIQPEQKNYEENLRTFLKETITTSKKKITTALEKLQNITIEFNAIQTMKKYKDNPWLFLCMGANHCEKISKELVEEYGFKIHKTIEEYDMCPIVVPYLFRKEKEVETKIENPEGFTSPFRFDVGRWRQYKTKK